MAATASEIKQTKQKIHLLMKKWVGPIGLGWFAIKTKYNMNCGESSDQEYSVLAKCTTRWEYRVAEIEFNMHACAYCDDESLEQVVVHELMHIFVNEMREEGIKHEERVCETLSKAFVWLWKHVEKKHANQSRSRVKRKGSKRP